MYNECDLDRQVQAILDRIVGEPLSGSGFEHEVVEADFSSREARIAEELCRCR